LFKGVLATGGDAVSIEELVSQSIERSPTPSQSVSRAASEASSVPSKRSASTSIVSSSKRRLAPADRIGRELGGLTAQLANLVAVMEIDYQRDAIRIVEEQYKMLQAPLKYAVLEAFEKEYIAKTFCVMRPESRRKWVRKLPLDRKPMILGVDLSSEQFDSAMDSIEWEGNSNINIVSF